MIQHELSCAVEWIEACRLVLAREREGWELVCMWHGPDGQVYLAMKRVG